MFKSFSKFSFFAAALLPTCINAYPNPTTLVASPKGGSPTLCKKGLTYFLFTGGVGIPMYTATNVAGPWTQQGVVFPDGAPWTAPYTGGDNLKLWAPDCTVVDGAIRLFYSASTIGSRNSAIFYAYSTTGASGSWTNGGLVVKTTTSDNYNAIDPNLSVGAHLNHFRPTTSQIPVDPVPYLSFGSYWSGIKGVRLNPTTYMPLSTTYDSLAARTNGAQPQGNADSEEAPVIFSFHNFWYLFTSWNADKEYYQVHVARSSTYNGGYVGQQGLAATNNGGGLILPPHDSILGPGGQDIFLDSDGTVYMVYHYKTGSSGNLAFHIGLNKLDMSSGWPVVV
ncbi:glycosyl hydrolase [Favolaschia claudopus]|uniref:Endo-1,5-alpha-L-arabinanase A n=1 Tax=Favolaschia claudopus TaxID=2862362 RepID=A0AAW0AUN8_9AGAR